MTFVIAAHTGKRMLGIENFFITFLNSQIKILKLKGCSRFLRYDPFGDPYAAGVCSRQTRVEREVSKVPSWDTQVASL